MTGSQSYRPTISAPARPRLNAAHGSVDLSVLHLFSKANEHESQTVSVTMVDKDCHYKKWTTIGRDSRYM